jgi:hypothetical protein
MNRLTIEQLEAIRERAEKATEGPWFAIHNTDISVESPPGSCDINSIAYADRVPDAEFIANARQDIPALLAEVDRLRKLALEILDEYDHSERLYIGSIGDYERQRKTHEKYIEYYKAKINGEVGE